ncbi:thymidine phosphorylase, partial [Oceaniglobus roseus]|uniref:thymidine phosphorylase n=1 Tax=Oceaniglobus roseus TaxID=1737570 RepID=UPI000C7F2BF1
MEPRTVLAALRAGQAPAPEALRAFAAGLADGRVSDAQAGAFAMAACLNGLGEGGAVALTEGMRDSGDVLAWDLPGPVVDKHSTGGIGDPVSLVLAPALAALGCYVPMISGRGLGHTGGTLDKLEAIPDLSTDLPEERFRAVVGEVGCAIVSATARIAPADRRLYAIRDVTGTVDSLDLITASILSKKLAAGLGALVLDVKCGSGAFMADLDAARALARALVDTANGAGCPTLALITDMDQPLAGALGNALELHEVIACLRGATDTPLAGVTLALGGELLSLAGVSATPEAGQAALRATLQDGRAAERFARMTAAMGGRGDVVADPSLLPVAPVQIPVAAP